MKLLNRWRLKRPIVWVSALGLLGVILAGLWTHQAILQAIGGYLVVQDHLEPADAIVVLMGSYPDRILEGVRLYHQGYGRRMLVTKGIELPGFREAAKLGAPIADYHDLSVELALRLGAPRSALFVMDPRANSTRAEAEIILRYIREHRLRSVIVVTSKSHTRRARQLFRRANSGGLTVMVSPTAADPFDPAGWWKDRNQLGQVLFEYQKLAFSFAESLVGFDRN